MTIAYKAVPGDMKENFHRILFQWISNEVWKSSFKSECKNKYECIAGGKFLREMHFRFLAIITEICKN